MSEKYIKLAKFDFKCLEQCIKNINKYEYEDTDAIGLMGKLFDDIRANDRTAR